MTEAHEGLLINPGGENLTVCKHCVGHAAASAKWESRFFALLGAHQRALRLMEELSDR